jgi:hypothetical protein
MSGIDRPDNNLTLPGLPRNWGGLSIVQDVGEVDFDAG